MRSRAKNSRKRKPIPIRIPIPHSSPPNLPHLVLIPSLLLCVGVGVLGIDSTPLGYDHSTFWPAVLKDDEAMGKEFNELEAKWKIEDGRTTDPRPPGTSGGPPLPGSPSPAAAGSVPNSPPSAASAGGSASPAPAGSASPVPAPPGGIAASQSPTPTLTPSGWGNSTGSTRTPPTSQRGIALDSKSTVAAASDAADKKSRPAGIDTSKAALVEVSPLPAPPTPNTPILIPAELLKSPTYNPDGSLAHGSTPHMSARSVSVDAATGAALAAAAGTATPPAPVANK